MADRKRKSGWAAILWILLWLFGGCMTYEEIVAEAEASGDWSRVEAFEARRERMENREAAAESCRDAGRVYVCDGKQSSKYTTCACLDSWGAQQALGSHAPF